MRLKQLRGLPVVDPTAARKIGTVADYQVDPAAGRLAALDVTPRDGGEHQRILAQRIRRVGGSAVMLTARGGSLPNDVTELNERWLDASTLVGLEVMGDDGNQIGQLLDATFNQDTLQIEAYLLRGSWLEWLARRGRHIQPQRLHSCSRELMLVTTGRVKAAEPESVEPTTETTIVTADGRMPLKQADRLAEPIREPVPDGHATGASPR